MRIPQGVSNSSTISVHGDKSSTNATYGNLKPFVPQTSGIHWVDLKPGSTKIVLNLDFTLSVVPQSNNAVSVYYGPLLYSLDIPYTESQHVPLNWTDRTPLAADQLLPSVHDHTLIPQNGSWAVAIDADQIKVEEDFADPDLPSPIFARGQPPVSLSVVATNIEWAITNDTADLPPTTPVAVGSPFRAKLVPFGSAKLHIAEFPTLKLDTP